MHGRGLRHGASSWPLRGQGGQAASEPRRSRCRCRCCCIISAAALAASLLARVAVTSDAACTGSAFLGSGLGPRQRSGLRGGGGGGGRPHGGRTSLRAEEQEQQQEGTGGNGSSPEFETLKLPLGPGKPELVVLQRKQLEEEAAALEAYEEGNLTQQELFVKYGSRFAGEGNGWRVWPASLFLAQFLVNCPSFIRGKSVVEVGCGCGVAGIAAALAGAKEVLMTDRDPTVLEIARRNVAENGLDGAVRVGEPLDWVEKGSWPRPLPPCDIVIGADVLFNLEVQEHLVEFIDSLLPDSGRALICDPRQRLTRGPFREHCENLGLEIGTMFDTEDMFLLNVMRVVAPGVA